MPKTNTSGLTASAVIGEFFQFRNVVGAWNAIAQRHGVSRQYISLLIRKAGYTANGLRAEWRSRYSRNELPWQQEDD